MSKHQDHEIIKIADEVPTNPLTQLYIEENISLEENLPHNGKPIIKMAISPRSEYVLTYSQEDESFVGWLVNDDSGPLIIDEDAKPFSKHDICDFKVSDKKVIMYDNNNSGEVQLNNFSNYKTFGQVLIGF